MQFQNAQTQLVADMALLDSRMKYVLWIGLCPASDTTLIEALKDEGVSVAFVEAYEPNADHIRRLELGAVAHMTIRDYLGDPDPCVENGLPPEFDLIVWQHGPQTMSEDELWPMLPRLQERAGVALVMQMPMGSFKKEYPVNPFDVHRSVLFPEQFLIRDYEVIPHVCRHERSFTAVKYTQPREDSVCPA
ncbi:MAG: hypothetical protein HN742_20605 [Lentisphaerae bacterium]|jgi:hypothetical protein|nr:hypothetical protein [Lentisphaerota bacterium]MBT4815171.1 hypothetical protein [Lentisphaerota bacterium]MBT5604948.1 hypothetical protein [Lentisphaerota bacterium]MBT7056458.1 hypothetical protein [Lentisphaerota bacterium]MBT7844293.1 hypothetical protein [Lentisphaerota bacterium]